MCRETDLCVFVDSPEVQEDHVLGREIAPYPSFPLARDWVNECIENHEDCHSDAFPLLPTRVIDIEPICSSREPRLIITDGKRSPYVTLSHCWGKSPPLVTNEENLERHLRAIPFQELPQTFKDAVTTTRELGFRFLWIDSLCILQGSPADWAQESSRMAAIYKNSAFTIACPDTTDSFGGFLYQRALNDTKWTWEYNTLDGGVKRKVTLRPRPDLQGNEVRNPGADSNLAKRGWVLQERLLSTRILYFCAKSLAWECNTHIRYEDWHYPLRHKYQQVSKNYVTNINHPYPRIKWYWIVMEFTKRSLTDQADKLPALSGLAHLLWSQQPHEYVGGLLRSDLHVGLAWFAERDEVVVGKVKSPPAGSGPSWSWTKSDSPVMFYHALLGVDYSFWGSTSIVPENDLEILDTQIVLESADPFGKIRSGSLRVCGRIKAGIIRKHINRFGEEVWWLCDGNSRRQFGYQHWAMAGRHQNPSSKGLSAVICRFWPDDPSWKLLRVSSIAESIEGRQLECEREVVCLCLVAMRGWTALVLEPVQKETAKYRRVGMAGCIQGMLSYQGQRPYDTWFDTVEKQLVEII